MPRARAARRTTAILAASASAIALAIGCTMHDPLAGTSPPPRVIDVCPGAGDAGAAPADVLADQLFVAPARDGILVGASVQVGLYERHTGAEARDLTAYASWSSSDTSVAELDPCSSRPGVFRGVAAGTVTITATLGATTLTRTIAVTPPRTAPLSAQGFVHRQVYHSPEVVGFTEWASATRTESGVFLGFTQATGPAKPSRMTPQLQQRFPWATGGYDMTQYDLATIFLEDVASPKGDAGALDSRDGGDGGDAAVDAAGSWRQVAADPFASPASVSLLDAVSLPDGSLVRLVAGQYLPFDAVPSTTFVQRSFDGGRTWGAPIPVLDPARFFAYGSRIVLLRDGRLGVTGGMVQKAAASWTSEDGWYTLPFLAISNDRGATWSDPTFVMDQRVPWSPTEEWTFAELPNGDLIALIRVGGDVTLHLVQQVAKKQGASWAWGPWTASPLMLTAKPNLLETSGGALIYAGLDGFKYTLDGVSWIDLGVPPPSYYPKCVEDDGRVRAFSHFGQDSPYGGSDEAILEDSFSLE